MPWQDRLREAAYTSPSGTRFPFIYEDIRFNVDKKTTAFEFPDAEGTYVQDLGNTGRRYPFRVIFSGPDYDLQATKFSAALAEHGIGKLETPVYGVIDVVPFGSITRRDALKSAGNQAIFEITFWETIGLIYPSAQKDPASSVQSSVSEYNTAISEEFETALVLDGAVDETREKSIYQRLLGKASDVLGPIADVQQNTRDQFNGIVDSINEGIDILVGQPLTLAFQTSLALQAPARAAADIGARLDAYRNLAQSIFSGDAAVVDFTAPQGSNDFHTNDLFGSGYVASSCIAVINTQFTTKTEALESADRILGLFDEAVAWRDSNFQGLDQIDTGQMYQQLQEVVAIAAGFLVEISFDLRQEHTITLDKPRAIVDLVAELYDGALDENLDFFIASNELTGDEILELPRGRTVVFYA